MQRDTEPWKNPSGPTEDERRIVKRNLGFFVAADSLAANNIVLGTYRRITAPMPPDPLRQAFEEAIHTHAYQYIVESHGLDEKKIFNAYNENWSAVDSDDTALSISSFFKRRWTDISDCGMTLHGITRRRTSCRRRKVRWVPARRYLRSACTIASDRSGGRQKRGCDRQR